MANSIAAYTDAQIMRCLLTHNFSALGRTFTDDAVTKIKAGAFYGATNLDEVSLPSVKEIGALAFAGSSIATLTLDWEHIESIGINAFQGNLGILPQNLVLSSLTAIGRGAFAGTSSARNTQLRTASLPQWTGSAPTDTGFSATTGVFAYCSAMTEVNVPLLASVPTNTFQYCTSLTEVVLPRAASIGGNSFQSCSNLKTLDIGGAVTSMSSAFLQTTSKLEALILRGVTSVPTITSSTFSSTRIATGYAYVYVPKSLEATFKVASNWATYAAQIRAIEDYPDVCGS